MVMAVPLFLLFSVYGIVNSCLPILLRSLGFNPSTIGILQGIFDAAGLLFPLFLSARVDKGGHYGWAMVLCGLVMAAVLPLMLFFPIFPVVALSMALFAIGYKGAVPVSDALLSRLLGSRSDRYGQIRVIGTIGFVAMTLLLQFTPLVNTTSNASIVLWTAIPALCFSFSVFLLPGLIKPMQPHTVAIPLGTVVDASNQTRSLARFAAMLKSFPRIYYYGALLIFLGFLGMVPSQRFFSLYVQEYLKLDSWAGLWALAAGAEVPLMFLSGVLIRRYGEKPLLLISLLAVALRNLVYAVFPSFGGAVAGQLLHSLCFGLFHPVAIYFVIRHSPRHLVAVGMALYSSVVVGFSSILGNVLGGYTIDLLGYRPLFIIFSVFPLIGAALFLAFNTVLKNTSD